MLYPFTAHFVSSISEDPCPTSQAVYSFTSARKLLHVDLFSWIFPGPQILLPRSAGEQVNTSFLDLGNFSTTAINISSADSTLVLKVQYDVLISVSWTRRGQGIGI